MALRVLIVTPRFVPFAGGVENHVYQVARRLVLSNTRVMVLTTDTEGKLPEFEIIDDVEVRRIRAWPSGYDLYFAPGLFQCIQRDCWDIVHIQSYHTFVAPIAMLASIRVGLPFVVTFHGGGHSSTVRNRLRGLQRRAMRPLLARASQLIATAQFEIDKYSRELGLPASRFVLIPNGADLPPVADMGCIGGNSLILSVGRLEKYKGHHRVLEAMPAILQQRPEACLWIVGSGPYEAELKRRAGELGLAEKVEIRALPPSDRIAMARAIASADLVTLLSEFETHPISVLEALALGRPVLVADTSGLRELAARGLARAVSLDSSTDQIAGAILDEMGKIHIRPAIDLPTWDECAAQLLTLYETIYRGDPA